MKDSLSLGVKGRALLRVIVAEIQSGRIDPKNKKSLISYSEALGKLGAPKPWFRPGKRLQAAGLTELNEWTRDTGNVPHVCGLIVNKKSGEPSDGFPISHGRPANGNWRQWWEAQVAGSVAFNWTPYV
jgi:hypothetical protein